MKHLASIFPMREILLAIICVCLLALAFVPLANLYFLGGNSLVVDGSAQLSLEQLGQLGDFFGGHTAAFSGLLSVALILYFSARQSESQQRHFEEQLRISKQAADLASISNIYGHYGENYGGANEFEEILGSVARGHRRWAIRESFSIIDPEGALEIQRKKQVAVEFSALIREIHKPNFASDNFRRAAELTSSLLLDKRLDQTKREDLWELYEVLRDSPKSLFVPDSATHKRFANTKRALSAKYRVDDA